MPRNPNGGTKGVVEVVTTSKDKQRVLSEETFEMPKGVRILEATGDKITFYADDVLRFVFDVEQRRFTFWPEIPSDFFETPTAGPSPNIPKKTAAPPPLLYTPAPPPGMPYPYPPDYP